MPNLRSLIAGLVSLLMGLSALACRPSPAPAHRASLTVLMHPIARARIGQVLGDALEAALPGTSVEVRGVERSREIVAALQDGRADIALTFADTAYLAFTGELTTQPHDHLRGIATLNTNRLYILVRQDSRFRDVADFKGRRVSVGLDGGGTDVSARSVLEGLHIDAVESHESFDDAVARLSAGSIDAVFALGSQPLEPLRKALADGARLVSLPETAVTRLHGEYPFLRPSLIPAGIYGPVPVMGVGVDRVLLCREGLNSDIVFPVTKAFFEALPQLSSLDVLLREMNVETAKATSVPLHEGAARYFRQQEPM